MHRTESDGNVGNLYSNGNPSLSQIATIVDDTSLNSFQEEIATVVEGAGLTLLTPGTDTFDQLLIAIGIIIQNGGTQIQQTIDNNSGPLDIGAAGELEFDDSVVDAIVMKYHIKRRTDSQSVREVGELKVVYNNESSSWEAPEWNSEFDDSDVTFSTSLVSGGPNNGFLKLQYTSGDLTGTTYSGNMTITDVKVLNK